MQIVADVLYSMVMKQTIIVESDVLVHIREGRLALEDDSGKVMFSSPLDSIGVVVIEALHARISAYAMQSLASAGAVVCVCDRCHMPGALTIPVAGNYATHEVAKAQIGFGSFIAPAANYCESAA